MRCIIVDKMCMVVLKMTRCCAFMSFLSLYLITGVTVPYLSSYSELFEDEPIYKTSEYRIQEGCKCVTVLPKVICTLQV